VGDPDEPVPAGDPAPADGPTVSLTDRGNGPTVPLIPVAPLIGAAPAGPSARTDWAGPLGVIALTNSRTATTAGSGATCPPSAATPASEPTASTAPVALASRMRGELFDRSMTR